MSTPNKTGAKRVVKKTDTASNSNKFFSKIHKCVDFACVLCYNPRHHAFARGRSLKIEEIDGKSRRGCPAQPWLTVQPGDRHRMKSDSDHVQNVHKSAFNIPKRPKSSEKCRKMGSEWVTFFRIIWKTSVFWVRSAQRS